ncbi:MAG: hypothetical protein EB015_09645 [Methylocystaceae bacterium]|nr:hypothetical protein [Methylocystaceae bacterium]
MNKLTTLAGHSACDEYLFQSWRHTLIFYDWKDRPDFYDNCYALNAGSHLNIIADESLSIVQIYEPAHHATLTID